MNSILLETTKHCSEVIGALDDRVKKVLYTYYLFKIKREFFSKVGSFRNSNHYSLVKNKLYFE